MGNKTKAEAEQTRQHLLDAAELLFLQRGVSRTSLQDIASAAGATRGAIYWHFKDKADLFNAMMARVVLPLELALQSAAPGLGEAASGCALQRLVDAFVGALHATVHDPQTRRVFTIATHQVEYVEELRAVAERRLEVTRGVLAVTAQALQAASDRTGHPLPMPVATAALGIHAVVDGLINHWLLDPDAFDLEAVGRHALHNHLRGLGLCLENGLGATSSPPSASDDQISVNLSKCSGTSAVTPLSMQETMSRCTVSLSQQQKAAGTWQTSD